MAATVAPAIQQQAQETAQVVTAMMQSNNAVVEKLNRTNALLSQILGLTPSSADRLVESTFGTSLSS